MKNPSEHLTKWRKYYAKNCNRHEGGYEKMPLSCICETSAQVAVHIECVIPDEYGLFELNDFTGEMKDGRKVIKPTVVQLAKEALVDYCWEGIDHDEIGNYNWATWWPKSAMQKRRKNGNSIVIYGNPWSSNMTGGLKTFKQPIGRTMLASIVMKEAIRMRSLNGHMADTYAWVSYNRLYDKLMQRAKDGGSDYSEELISYEMADWLCVDGFEIEKQNDATKSFKAKVLDSFFDDRIRMGLPNILVFQDDISQDHFDLRQEFGISVNSIINSAKTARVKLLDSKEKK